MIGSTCFYCDEIIEPNIEKPCQTYRTIPLERPYANLFLHVPCLAEVEKIGVEQYLNDNYDRIIPYNFGITKRTRKPKQETNNNSEDKGDSDEHVSTEDE